MSTPFREVLSSDRFTITCEVAPPKGTDVQQMMHHIDLLVGKVDAINVTDHQSSVMRLSSLAGCLAIQELGGEAILQMTCRDRNRLALQGDLLFAYTRGLRNVLCLTGDAVVVGDNAEAKGVFDLDSVQLLHMINQMESGRDDGGNVLSGELDFFRGAVVTLGADPIEPQMIKFERKVEAGAEFFQTQAVFDLDAFAKFMDFARPFDVKILPGILLLSSARMARFVHNNVPGIEVPSELIKELAGASRGGALAKGVEIAARLISTLKENSLCDGVHIMAIGKEEVVPDILAAAGL